MQNQRKWHPGMQNSKWERMTNRAVLGIKIGGFIVKREKRGSGVYKKKEEQKEGIRFRNKE